MPESSRIRWPYFTGGLQHLFGQARLDTLDAVLDFDDRAVGDKPCPGARTDVGVAAQWRPHRYARDGSLLPLGAQASWRTLVMMLPDNYKIFLVADPVDMRRSFDGLSAVIVDRLGSHPMAGSLFLFRGRGGDRLKILWWDRNGLVFGTNASRKVVSNGPLRSQNLSR
jgi:hypothetical protein